MTKLYEIELPFSGFYNSIHDAQFDRELESVIDYFYQETGYDLPDYIMNLWWNIDFKSAQLAYAKDFAEGLMDELNIFGDFTTMTSPREYNFENDRLFVKVSRATLCGLVFMTDPYEMEQAAKRRHTSRSGFISFYSNDYKTWGDIEDWDHNQLRTLLEAYIETNGIEIDESQIIDDCYLYEVHKYFTCDNITRFWNLTDYLRERSKREVKTWDDMIKHRRAENRPFKDTPLGSVA